MTIIGHISFISVGMCLYDWIEYFSIFLYIFKLNCLCHILVRLRCVATTTYLSSVCNSFTSFTDWFTESNQSLHHEEFKNSCTDKRYSNNESLVKVKVKELSYELVRVTEAIYNLPAMTTVLDLHTQQYSKHLHSILGRLWRCSSYNIIIYNDNIYII